MPLNVPSYPIVDVTVRDDGSAHVNVAGEHVDLPAGDVAATRRAIIAQAQAVAVQLGRPVRMRATDPAGSWLQAVDIDGSVIDMTPVAGKKRPKPAARPMPAPSANSTASSTTQSAIPEPAPLPAESTTQPAAAVHPTSLPADIEHTVLAARRSAGAVLRFSTGEVVTVTGAMIIGRRPAAPDGDSAHLVTIYDESCTLSKTHARVEVAATGITVIDLGSGNGTFRIAKGETTEFTAGVPYPVHDGDRLELGEVTATISIAA